MIASVRSVGGEMISRKDYIDGKNSTDKHMNDIPLRKWDSLRIYPRDGAMKECGDYLTLAGKVCIAKAAARMIKEES